MYISLLSFGKDVYCGLSTKYLLWSLLIILVKWQHNELRKFINKRKLIRIFSCLCDHHTFILFFSAKKETSNLKEVDELFNYDNVFTIIFSIHEVIFWRAAVTFSLTKMMINYSILSIVRRHKNLSKSILFKSDTLH